MAEPSPLRLLVALAAASAASRAVLLFAPPLSDEAVHLLGSWTLLDGGRLYEGFVDNKPPLVHAWFAAAQLLLGRGIGAVRLLTVLVALPLTGLAASAFLGHGRRGRWAALLFVVFSAAYLPEDALPVHTELLMLLPAAWALALLQGAGPTPSWLGAGGAGVLLGLAALFKPTAALWLAAFPLAVLAERGWAAGRGPAARVTAATLAGFALPLAATALLFAREGLLPALVEWTVLANVRYVGASLGPSEWASRAARGLLPWLAATGVLWWACARGRGEGGLPRARIDSLVLCSLPAVFVGGRFFGHYFLQVLFPLCLGAAPAAARLSVPPLGRAAKRAGTAVVVVVAGFLLANAWLVLGRDDVVEDTFPLHRGVAAFLGADPCREGASLFVWGIAPRLYVETGLRPASRFVLPQETVSGHRPGRRDGDPSAVREEHRALLLADLRAREATYVLDLAPSGFHRWGRFPLTSFPGLYALVRESYEVAGVVEGVVVHRLRGCTGSARTR
jgi:hypothetical protein